MVKKGKTTELNYDNIPINESVRNGMSLNPYDQLFIKRLFDRQDEVIGRVIEAMTDVLKEKFNKQTTLLEKIQEDISCIKETLDNHEARISALEERLLKVG